MLNFIAVQMYMHSHSIVDQGSIFWRLYHSSDVPKGYGGSDHSRSFLFVSRPDTWQRHRVRCLDMCGALRLTLIWEYIVGMSRPRKPAYLLLQYLLINTIDQLNHSALRGRYRSQESPITPSQTIPFYRARSKAKNAVNLMREALFASKTVNLCDCGSPTIGTNALSRYFYSESITVW